MAACGGATSRGGEDAARDGIARGANCWLKAAIGTSAGGLAKVAANCWLDAATGKFAGSLAGVAAGMAATVVAGEARGWMPHASCSRRCHAGTTCSRRCHVEARCARQRRPRQLPRRHRWGYCRANEGAPRCLHAPSGCAGGAAGPCRSPRPSASATYPTHIHV